VEVYGFSAGFPWDERYGMTSQLRRSALSVGSNIAEASKRKSQRDKGRILNISQSEGAETMSVLDVADRVGYGRKGEARRFIEKYDELEAMLETLCQRVLSTDSEL
jgi:four helix bundle protein